MLVRDWLNLLRILVTVLQAVIENSGSFKRFNLRFFTRGSYSFWGFKYCLVIWESSSKGSARTSTNSGSGASSRYWDWWWSFEQLRTKLPALPVWSFLIWEFSAWFLTCCPCDYLSPCIKIKGNGHVGEKLSSKPFWATQKLWRTCSWDCPRFPRCHFWYWDITRCVELVVRINTYLLTRREVQLVEWFKSCESNRFRPHLYLGF